jgi:NAD(P)-dependent dehydrogenase (short-subunit alcohol dehydrogenase family)
VTGVQGDAAKLDDLDRLYETVKKDKGHIDMLFANAGQGGSAPLGSVTEEQFDTVFNLNVRGTLFTVQKALPLFRDGGSIVMNGSIAGVKGFPGSSVYSASKAAVRSFARTWLTDLKDRRIRVKCAEPRSDRYCCHGKDATGKEGAVPVDDSSQRTGRPEEIATAALFLASDDSSFVNGVELYVDGGASQI